MSKEPDFLSPEDVARLFGVSASTVRRWADTGRLPLAHRTLGGVRRFRREDVEALMKEAS